MPTKYPSVAAGMQISVLSIVATLLTGFLYTSLDALSYRSLAGAEDNNGNDIYDADNEKIYRFLALASIVSGLYTLVFASFAIQSFAGKNWTKSLKQRLTQAYWIIIVTFLLTVLFFVASLAFRLNATGDSNEWIFVTVLGSVLGVITMSWMIGEISGRLD